MLRLGCNSLAYATLLLQTESVDLWNLVDLSKKSSTPTSVQVVLQTDQAIRDGDSSALTAILNQEIPNQDGASDEARDLFSLVSLSSKSIPPQIKRQKLILQEIEQEISTTVPEKRGQVFIDLLTSDPPLDETGQASNQPPALEDTDLGTSVFDSFPHEIIPTNTTGLSRIWRVTEQSDGAPIEGGRLKITWRNPDDSTRTAIVTSDIDGAFKFDIPDGAVVIDVRLGEDLIEVDSQDLALARLATPRITQPVADISQSDAQSIVRLYGSIYELWIQLVSGRRPQAEMVRDLSPPEQLRRVRLGASLLHAMLADNELSKDDMLEIERSLREKLRDKPFWQDIQDTWHSVSVEQIFLAPPIATRFRPIDVAAVTETSVPDDLLLQALNTAVRQSLDDDEQHEARIIERIDGVVFMRVTASTRIDVVRLRSNLETSADMIFEVGLERKAAAEVNDFHLSTSASRSIDNQIQWALERIGLDAATVNHENLQPCVVAVVGTGVDWTHPDLLGQMWVNMAEKTFNGVDDDGNGFIDDVFGWNFVADSPDVIDHSGHDTHVAGIIGARRNHQSGTTGVNPHARIMALKVAGVLGETNSVAIGRAIYYAVNRDARVINISYTGKQSSRVEQRAIEFARSKGVLVVVPSGNNASDVTDMGLVGLSSELTVAGTDSDDHRAPFSGWGQAIDLAAPAVNILSLRARGTDFLIGDGRNAEYQSSVAFVGDSQRYYRASGTSFSAALVSGAASVLISRDMDLDAEQVRKTLVMSAHDIDVIGWDQNTGAGRLDLRQASIIEPHDWLVSKIHQLHVSGPSGDRSIVVVGTASGNDFRQCSVQLAFGASPADQDWTNIHTSFDPVDRDQVALIDGSRFGQSGAWTVRLLVTDGKSNVRESRANLNLR